jgi:hypothetical protein
VTTSLLELLIIAKNEKYIVIKSRGKYVSLQFSNSQKMLTSPKCNCMQ